MGTNDFETVFVYQKVTPFSSPDFLDMALKVKAENN